MRRLASTLLVLPLTVGAFACGDDDDGGSKSAIKRYCDLSKKLDAIEQPDEAETAEELASQMDKFFKENAKLIDDLSDAAPDEIKADLEKAFDVFRDVAKGNLESIQDLNTDKLDEFNSKNCE